MKRETMLMSTGMALAMLFSLAVSAQEATPSVDEIVKKTNHVAYYQGKDGRARVKMTITDKQGNTREREFTILRRNMDENDGEQRFFVHFHRPADVRDMVFMVWKYVGKDDNRWLYLPALDVVRQIAASDERTSFVGSSFFYEDVSGRGIEEDNHELVEVTNDYYVLRNTPKDPSKVEFDSYKMYVHKSTFIPVRVEFEKGGNVYRVGEALKVEDIQGYKTVTKARMNDTNLGLDTTLEYLKVEYDLGIPENIFTERYLRRPPVEYLK
ncbi:MAG: outer membrane lipoprotein-sorting protein [Candidatus Hydrogenedentes bacterium]|nr:outer membrane lipoprotein-sorting protein [Candidatus Hydrogenedentota bacterium]HOJ69012.1 outer membrane lipoprotein-sorting protein [Candidatus Hydrogenedentota bacterium]